MSPLPQPRARRRDRRPRALNAVLQQPLTNRLGLTAGSRRYDNDNRTPQIPLRGRLHAVRLQLERHPAPSTCPTGTRTTPWTRSPTTPWANWAWRPAGSTTRRWSGPSGKPRAPGRTSSGWPPKFRGDWAGPARASPSRRPRLGRVRRGPRRAGVLPPGAGRGRLPVNQAVLRRYDQAERDLARVGRRVECRPAPEVQRCSRPTPTRGTSTTMASAVRGHHALPPGRRSSVRAASRRPWGWSTTATTASHGWKTT